MKQNEPKEAGDERRRISRRSVAVGLGLASTAAVAAALTPRHREQLLGSKRIDRVIPARAGPWQAVSGGQLILPDSPQHTDVYDQVYAQEYVAPRGLPNVMLVVAYGAAQSGLMKVHRPEVCYAGSGFRISNDKSVELPLRQQGSIPARTFLATRDDRIEQVLYWIRISNQFPQTLYEQRLIMVERGLRGTIPDGVLVRFSVLGDDLKTGAAAMEHFAQTLVLSANPAGRALMAG